MTIVDKVLRPRELCEVTGYRPTQIADKIANDPDFPKPFKLSKTGRGIGFFSSEVAAYQAKRAAERDRELQQAKQQPRAETAPAKRPVGRPRKTPAPDTASAETAPKKRGRPPLKPRRTPAPAAMVFSKRGAKQRAARDQAARDQAAAAAAKRRPTIKERLLAAAAAAAAREDA